MIIHINLNGAIESCIKSSRGSTALWVISRHFYLFNPTALWQEITSFFAPRNLCKKPGPKLNSASPSLWAPGRKVMLLLKPSGPKAASKMNVLPFWEGLANFPALWEIFLLTNGNIVGSLETGFPQPLACLPACVSFLLWVTESSGWDEFRGSPHWDGRGGGKGRYIFIVPKF